jgi:hypothetical protein
LTIQTSAFATAFAAAADELRGNANREIADAATEQIRHKLGLV